MSSLETIQAVKSALSIARMSTYEAEVRPGWPKELQDSAAVALYAWNGQLSAALLMPLHICEVVIRNAVAEALDATYGARWPWSTTFEQSLPGSSKLYYSPRNDIKYVRSRFSTTGKVIPELKFAFWQNMFTSRHDIRIWDSLLIRVAPNLDQSKSVGRLRQEIYNDLEQIRRLRNRIAHHEPIFKRDLTDDLQKIASLIAAISKETAAWMMENQQAAALIAARPKRQAEAAALHAHPPHPS